MSERCENRLIQRFPKNNVRREAVRKRGGHFEYMCFLCESLNYLNVICCDFCDLMWFKDKFCFINLFQTQKTCLSFYTVGQSTSEISHSKPPFILFYLLFFAELRTSSSVRRLHAQLPYHLLFLHKRSRRSFTARQSRMRFFNVGYKKNCCVRRLLTAAFRQRSGDRSSGVSLWPFGQ